MLALVFVADDDLARGAPSCHKIQSFVGLSEGEDTVDRRAYPSLLDESSDLRELATIAPHEEEVIVCLILPSLLIQLAPYEAEEPLLPQRQTKATGELPIGHTSEGDDMPPGFRSFI